MDDQLYYVGITDAADMRRELLTSSKNVLDGLKRYERYKNIRQDKLGYIMELKRVFDELLVLNKKLRGKLPKTVGKPPAPKTETRKTKKKEAPRSQLSQLEDELSKIEERLSSLE